MKGLLLQARRAAKKRNQTLSTAHALLVMVQAGGQLGRVLLGAGLRESELLRLLPMLPEEPAGALDRALERSFRLLKGLGLDAFPVHLLLLCLRDPRTQAAICLEEARLDKAKLEEALAGMLSKREVDALGLKPLRLRRLIDQGGVRTPYSLRPKDALMAPLRSHGKPVQAQQGADSPRLRVARSKKRSPGVAKPAKLAEPSLDGLKAAQASPAAPSPAQPGGYALDPEQLPFLAAVARNLTLEAFEGRLDPLLGREQELEQMLDVLLRRRSNNPLLVGPPGVGKTALVEGLAEYLVRQPERVPHLAGVRIVEVSAGTLVSGTGVRGAVAERVKRLRDEVVAADGTVLLFIDEIHNIVGGDGPDDLAQELKAALARGQLPCIGATTEQEYQRTIERDAALARRFSLVSVLEPSCAESERICEGLLQRYEAHHQVRYDEDTVELSVRLTHRYLPEQRLPDKAIGVLDQAAARARRLGETVVGRDRIAEVVSERAGVPRARLAEEDHGALLDLEVRLSERIVGHKEALAKVGELLRLGAAGLRTRGPLGVFLLTGPTGVGKTELARAVADEMFGAGCMVRLDMSEYAEAHSVARLVGAPPGYVGHQDGGQLTEPVRRRPYSLILLDEVEKAHPDVLMALLPLMDEGHLTDSQGRRIDFRNAVLFLTSNLGASSASVGKPIGFGAAPPPQKSAGKQAIDAVRAALPAEFYNRIDEPLYFGALTEAELRTVAERLLGQVEDRLLQEHRVCFRREPKAVEALLRDDRTEAGLGARSIRRAVSRHVEAPLARLILAGDLHGGDEVVLTVRGASLELVPTPKRRRRSPKRREEPGTGPAPESPAPPPQG